MELRLIGDVTEVGDSEIALQVGGITCASCSQIVHMALSGVAGVQAVELRATQDQTVLIAVVSCDDSVGARDLATVTNDLGYPTTIVEDES
jgi:copper chaperone CopZ